MKVAIPAFGSISHYVHLLQNKDTVELCVGEIIDRKNKRNRYTLLATHGKQQHTIPILEPRNRKTLLEARICNEEPWQKNQWKSIKTAYNNAPFFEFYDYKLKPLFNKEYDSLLDFNKDCLQFVLKALKAPINPKENTETTLPIPSYKVNLKPYGQVFSDSLEFHPDLCILDLIFNLGPDALNYLLATAPSSE